jgi:AcrR family transcriptional regulator
MTHDRTDGRLLRGDQTRRAILRHAVDVASVDGLEGLSIGRLAGELRVSKSGLFAHFGSKEELQLATVRAAVEIFVERVVRPAEQEPPGLRRVWRLCEAWLEYASDPVFPGGCFFYSTAAEFDARPGRVRDAIARARRDWLRLNETAVDEARQLGELHADVVPAQLAFELDAFTRAANAHALLHDDPSAYGRARTAVLTRLRAAATDPSVLDTVAGAPRG